MVFSKSNGSRIEQTESKNKQVRLFRCINFRFEQDNMSIGMTTQNQNIERKLNYVAWINTALWSM